MWNLSGKGIDVFERDAKGRGGIAVLKFCRMVLLSSLAILASIAWGATAASAATDPYEPNDTFVGATGPLANQQGYAASLGSENDKDFFYFYVTAPSSQVTVTLTNLGGAAVVSYVGMSILNTSGTPVGSVPIIEEGDAKSIAVTLEPQKYFVEVVSAVDYGDSYSLQTSGSGGAFGPYSAIAGTCAGARSATATAQAGLTKSQAKLQRAKARLRRSLFASDSARRSARAAFRKAKSRVAGGRKTLEKARASERPWCFVPQ